MVISSGWKMGKIEFRFDKISICACPYLLFVLLGSVAAENIAKIEDFARKKPHSVRQLWEKFISFLFTSSCFYSVFFVRFFDGLGVEYHIS